MTTTMTTDATPIATTLVCTSKPVHSPKVTCRPAFLPLSADWVSTKMLSGPGARPNATEAVKKSIRVSNVSIMTSMVTFKMLFVEK